jgi:hypothetical protein
MAERKLKTAIQTQGHIQALKDGSVKPTSFAFEFEEVPAIIPAFRRILTPELVKTTNAGSMPKRIEALREVRSRP